MGQPVTFLSTTSPKLGVLRFELNRSLTGMGHERYRAGDEILGNRPPDVLARRVFEAGEIESIHIYGSMVTVTLASNDVVDLEAVVRELYTYYVPGVEIPSDEELIAMVEQAPAAAWVLRRPVASGAPRLGRDMRPCGRGQPVR